MMNKETLLPIYFRWLAMLVVACALQACASGPQVVNHAFSFDVRTDSHDVEVLDFRYGDSKLPGVRNPDWVLAKGESFQAANTNGPMLVGDSLYVKWRIKSSREVYQDTVDLRQRLPSDIKDHRIHFIVNGPQLYVYLISPEKLDPNPCMLKGNPRALARATKKADDIIFAMYCYRKIIPIYPDQLKN